MVLLVIGGGFVCWLVEFFVIDNIIDGFELLVVVIIVLIGMVVIGLILVDGVFWLNEC